MQSQNPIIADLVKLANSAAGTMAGMSREARESARERLREAFGGIDFVSRDVRLTGRSLPLTSKEFDLLAHLARGLQKVVQDRRPVELFVEVLDRDLRAVARDLGVEPARIGDAERIEAEGAHPHHAEVLVAHRDRLRLLSRVI